MVSVAVTKPDRLFPGGRRAQFSWRVEGAKDLYYPGPRQADSGSKLEYPQSTANFTLNMRKLDDSEEQRTVTVEVALAASCHLETNKRVSQHKTPTVVPQTPVVELTSTPRETPTASSMPTDFPEVPPTPTPEPPTPSAPFLKA